MKKSFSFMIILLCVGMMYSFPIIFGNVTITYDNRESNGNGQIINAIYFQENDNLQGYTISFTEYNFNFSISDFPFSINSETAVNDAIEIVNTIPNIDAKMSIDLHGDATNFTTLKIYVDNTLVIDKANNKVTNQAFILYENTLPIKFAVEMDGTVVSSNDHQTFDIIISADNPSNGVNYVFTRTGICSGSAT